MHDLTNAQWRKSTRSNGTANCVEVAKNLLGEHGVVAVRDSKDPAGLALVIGPSAWTVFAGTVKVN